MRKKIYLFSLLFCFSVTASSQQLAKKYDRATFTVVPIFTSITDTLASDTLYKSWSDLPHYAVFLSEVQQEIVQTDVIPGQKFYYNHTTVSGDSAFFVGKTDTVSFESAFALQTLNKEFRNLPDSSTVKPKYTSVPDFSRSSDEYASWLKEKLERSNIPGEMMMAWTNSDLLIARSDANMDDIDKMKNADKFSFNYFKNLLDKNYIIVQNTIKTSKYKVDPEIIKKEKAAKEAAERTKKKTGGSVASIIKDIKSLKEDLKKDKEVKEFVNPYAPQPQKFNKERLILDEKTFVKSYVYKIQLTDELIADLSSYPPVFPKNVVVEFVASTRSVTQTSSGRSSEVAKRRSEEDGIWDSIKKNFSDITTSETTFSDRYVAGKNAAVKLIDKGEYPCSKSIFTQLKSYEVREDEYLDSMIMVCDNKLLESPNTNRIAFNNASKIQQGNLVDFNYQSNCESFVRLDDSKNQNYIQGGFEDVILTLESNIPEFQVLTTVAETNKNKLKVNMDLSQGIYLNQQYKIIERRQDGKTGERFDVRVGTARVVRVSKDLYAGGEEVVDQTVLAQIDGKKARENAILVQNETIGLSLYAGYGVRYDDAALIFGADFALQGLLKYPVARVGIGIVSNTTTLEGDYKPLYFNVNASREFYFSRFFDFKPYVEVGYGGDFANDEAVKRSVFVGGGLGVPINIYNRKSTHKVKLMPEVSISTLGFKPQYSLQTKIEL